MGAQAFGLAEAPVTLKACAEKTSIIVRWSSTYEDNALLTLGRSTHRLKCITPRSSTTRLSTSSFPGRYQCWPVECLDEEHSIFWVYFIDSLFVLFLLWIYTSQTSPKYLHVSIILIPRTVDQQGYHERTSYVGIQYDYQALRHSY